MNLLALVFNNNEKIVNEKFSLVNFFLSNWLRQSCLIG